MCQRSVVICYFACAVLLCGNAVCVCVFLSFVCVCECVCFMICFWLLNCSKCLILADVGINHDLDR